MSPGNSDPTVHWLSFTCPNCRVKLRIKSAYAHMQGRCRECGYRIDPLQPAPQRAPALPIHTDEPLGLVPVEDEWPEPALFDGKEADVAYDLTSDPVTWAEPQLHTSAPVEAYPLAPSEHLPPRSKAVETSETPYELKESPPLPPFLLSADLGRVVEAEPVRPPPPPPPAYPFWEGLYSFPLRRANLAVWFFLTLDFCILIGLVELIVILLEAGGQAVLAIPLVIPLVGIVLFWTGIYAGNCFLAIIEETAAGNDEVHWPEGAGIGEGLGRFLFLVWIAVCCLIPVTLFWLLAPDYFPVSPIRQFLWWTLFLIPWLIIFPIALLSALAADSRWVLLDRRILLGFLMKPHVLILICLAPSFILLAGCLSLGYWTLTHPGFMTILGLGMLCSASLLIYGRLLGRAGWFLASGPVRSKKKKRLVFPRGEKIGGWGPDEPEDEDARRGEEEEHEKPRKS